MTQEQQPSETDRLFQSMQTINPVRDDVGDEEVPQEEVDGEQSLEERMEGSRKPTDFQVADKRLNPDLLHRHLNILEVSRTFPDVYNPLFRILVKDLVRNTGLSVAEAIAYVNTALSISIDGEGRLDIIAIARQGALASEEEKNKGAI